MAWGETGSASRAKIEIALVAAIEPRMIPPKPRDYYYIRANEELSTSSLSRCMVEAREPSFIFKTPIARALYELREKAIAEGMRLLSSDEIIDEVKRRRGGIHE
jgi:hypothetical protein